MKKVLIAASTYVQGQGEFVNIAEYLAPLGKKALLVISKPDSERFESLIGQARKNSHVEMIGLNFRGECSKSEIKRLAQGSTEQGCDIVVGIGGGKALDTAKCVAHELQRPCVVVPTIASTDAPCSSLSVIYTDEGEFEEYIHFKKNPDLVLVDTGIIAMAPTRYLVAGMGDALSTYFEARACERSFAKNIPGGHSTKAALALAKLCYETLLEDALKAKAASDANVVTQALENIVEANILLSGLGFESSGLAAAHAIHNGLTVMEEAHRSFHGEKVAFGVLVQLVLENASQQEFQKVQGFCRSVGLPTCLRDLGVEKIDHEKLRVVAKAACAVGETIHNMPFEVKPEDVYAAILTADQLGRSS